MSYFSTREIISSKKSLKRKNPSVKGMFFLKKPLVGDILKVFFSKSGSSYFFEGLCFKTVRKHFLLPDSSFSIINKVKGSGIVFIFSLFYNMVFSFEILSFKRKTNISGNSAKIYYMIRKNKYKVK
jgi:hypothetical protein